MFVRESCIGPLKQTLLAKSFAIQWICILHIFSGDLLFNLSRWHKCIVWALPGRQAGKYAEEVSLFVVGKEIFLCCPGPSCSLMWSSSITLRTKGRVTIPNRKNSKRPSIPPSFSENYIAIFFRKTSKKAPYKGRNLQSRFLDWKLHPPPLERFRKFICFVSLNRPL